ncbi:glycosyl hydrolase family 28 protein [Candidatus Latescibacterota bacterium]
MIYIRDSADVNLEGVILLDSSPWTVPIRRSDRVHVNNIKVIGYRANSDGIDICNSRDVTVENCFLRTLDDLIVIKSDRGQGEVRNIRVRKCVLWNELAHALSIGAELREDVDDVIFEDCDVIHDVGREWALRIYHCDSAVMSNIRFENIRIEEARRLISLWIGVTRWTLEDERGHIQGLTFKDISAVSALRDNTLIGFQDGPDWKPYMPDGARIELTGFDDEHAVEDVLFQNVTVDGKAIDLGDVNMNEFVRNVRYQP